jgi:hypothetical protein
MLSQLAAKNAWSQVRWVQSVLASYERSGLVKYVTTLLLVTCNVNYALTFGDGLFFQILAHPVFKM